MGERGGDTGFWWGNLRERDHLEATGIDRRIILKCMFGKSGGGDMDWIDLGRNRDSWRALLNTVMNVWVAKNAGNFSTS